MNILVLTVSGIAGGISLNLVKSAIHSPRPLTVFAPGIAAGRVYVNVMFERLYFNSFPSGHSQTAFTVATVLIWVYLQSDKTKLSNAAFIFAFASLVGLSRIYVGAHFPSDVLGGALLGSVTASPCCYFIGGWKPRDQW